MSSSVFFRFKSQKEPSRVTFDGTGISVFELKREIIALSRLGDGTDFELVISSEDTNESYDDDTAIIPRSTTVIAKRLPAAKAGRGGAARYVSGKMPQNAKNLHRSEAAVTKGAPSKISDTNVGSPDMNHAQTEDQKIATMFKIGADQWAQQQLEMANATPIHRGPPAKGKLANVPDRPPPSGYICYRCGEKGHWIQVCPTNDDPTFDGRPRVKRTTGIPRSFLKTIEKPTLLASDGTTDESKQPSGVMVNAEGEWVIAEPDKASWDQYQAKAKVLAAAQEAAALGSKDLQERGLECSIDKRLFVEPTKTPCCQTTYCHDCINNALLENDLRCPHCSAENILIDNLIPDKETAILIQKYEEENILAKPSEAPANSAKSKGAPSETPKKDSPDANHSKPLPLPSSKPLHESSQSPNISLVNGTKKRPAGDDLKSNRKPPGPSPEASKLSLTNSTAPLPLRQPPNVSSSGSLTYPMPPATNAYMLGMDAMAFSNGSSFVAFPMNIGPQMPLASTMLNTTMLPGGSLIGGNNGSWANPWGAGYAQQPANVIGNGFHIPTMPNGTYGQTTSYSSLGNEFMSAGMSNQDFVHFSNQQRTAFAPTLNEEDSAYFRKPVNPHRHQARRNINRPTDYREI